MDHKFTTEPDYSADKREPGDGIFMTYDRLQNWIHCICLVTFDIEIGQAIEKIYPPHIKLTESEKTNIGYLSFPDSNSACIGDTKFHFRIRLCPSHRRSLTTNKDYGRNGYSAFQIKHGYFYGFVHFRQVKDNTAKRGYFQKSLVILTSLPFINFFYKITEIIAPKYFENGDTSLFDVCNQIDTWPFPAAGSTLNLPLLESTFQIHIPRCDETSLVTGSPRRGSLNSCNTSESFQTLHQSPYVSTSTRIVIQSIYELNTYRSLLPIITHIQLLWELILTCEPIIVMAPTPDICSELVQALVSLILPLPFSSDYRPFFTVHDSDFREYTKKTQLPPPVILGVTNPFFAKVFQNWPHIIRINQSLPPTPSKNSKLMKIGKIKTLEFKPGLYSKYKPFLQRDADFLKQLVEGIETRRPYAVQNEVIRRRFLELTGSFLMPLEKYIASLMPSVKELSPFRTTPPINPFNPDDFFKNLDSTGPSIITGIKGDWRGLYKKFLKTSNFSSWYEERHLCLSQKLKALHIKSISEANLVRWAEDKAEVEVVDLVLKIKENLKIIETESLPVDEKIVSKLKCNFNQIVDTLPVDVQNFFRL